MTLKVFPPFHPSNPVTPIEALGLLALERISLENIHLILDDKPMEETYSKAITMADNQYYHVTEEEVSTHEVDSGMEGVLLIYKSIMSSRQEVKMSNKPRGI
ncbi:hypothetical protein DSO57_1036826 [Entomophthora muscae]|uniref:Uncharacterized protein n=1 Tax=Entomophthora muscae TaxID=34485 RepID=A0ACC2RDV7_9FUNG|nr:hypothetical protein DSO57_1036826 [Entomophthora muscae]